MLQFLICLIILIKNLVICYNVTNNRYYQSLSGDILTSRQHRLISFNSEGDIKLDLDFNVPFITLPIGKSIYLAKTSLINFNVGSIVLAGTIIFAAAIVLPILLTLFKQKGLIPATNPFNRFYNSKIGSQRSDHGLWKYVTALDNTLLENNIDFTACSQKITCWAVKKSSENVSKGDGSSIEKIFDGIISSKWFQGHMLNSMLIEAVEYGLNRESCSLMYKNCKINEESVSYLVKPFFDSFSQG